jgi:hypothetical protein
VSRDDVETAKAGAALGWECLPLLQTITVGTALMTVGWRKALRFSALVWGSSRQAVFHGGSGMSYHVDAR